MKTQANFQEKHAELLQQIQNWQQVQLIYTPHATVLIARSLTIDENGVQRVEMAENIPLHLPSSLPAHIIASPEMKWVCNMETQLRKVAANDALFEI